VVESTCCPIAKKKDCVKRRRDNNFFIKEGINERMDEY
jgi:hypothetical protein